MPVRSRALYDRRPFTIRVMSIEAMGAVRTAAEQVVLCDDDGAAIGTAAKADVHTAVTALHLAFSVYLFDAAGQVLVTRRAAHKSTFAGVRTNSCCGHPGPGESMVDAITRRVRYELGATPTGVELILPAFRYRATAADGTVENELCPVYRAQLIERTVAPNPDEVAAAWWQPWAQFADADADADALSAWSREQVRELSLLGPDPLCWATAGEVLLPPAAQIRSATR